MSNRCFLYAGAASPMVQRCRSPETPDNAVTSEPAKTKIVVVCGPTGIGKTGFAIALARQFNAEIVGADSMQIYRRMDIGTAKPTPEEKAAAPHHLVDVVEPDDTFDAAAYVRMADDIITHLAGRKVLPLVVGGTGLYIKTLVYGLFKGRSTDSTLRRKLMDQAEQAGSAALHARLAGKDPAAAARIHVNDSYRIIRALEIIETTGRPVSDQFERHGFARARYEALQIGLHMPRQALYDRIDKRVDMMVAQGLEAEVRRLLRDGYSPELKSMQSLGYRHMADFIQGRLAWDEALRTLKRDHRRYAKRQMTWFRAVPDIHWLEPGERARAQTMVRDFLSA